MIVLTMRVLCVGASCPNLRSADTNPYLVPDRISAKCELRDVIYILPVIEVSLHISSLYEFY